MLDTLFCTFLILLVSVCHTIASDSSPAIFISALLVAGTTVIHFLIYARMKLPSPADATVLLFEVFFVVVAPSLQIAVLGTNMANTAPLDETCAVTANLLFAMFTSIYMIVRYYIYPKNKRPSKLSAVQYERMLSVRGTVILLIICVIGAIISIQQISLEIQDAYEISPAVMFQRKYICFVPVPFLFAVIVQRRQHGRRRLLWIAALIISSLGVLITQNPIVERRNALGPVYLGLLLLVAPKLSNTSRRLFYVMASIFGVFFPVTALFTHNKNIAAWGHSDTRNIITGQFIQLHYDAWANVNTIVDIVNTTGLKWGRQLLGSILFFIPRDYWPDKPYATGIVIGNYISTMWFNNLSAPLAGEAYLDLGILGTIAAAVALALLTTYLDKLYCSGDPAEATAGIYFSLNLLFVLRGSLMVTVAFSSGAVFAFFTVRAVMMRRLRPRESEAPTSEQLASRHIQ